LPEPPLSPEQAEGRKVDARSDIFSFGSVLYEMVTGQRAFQGETKLSTLSAILHKEPQPASQAAEGVPRELERIITRCLRKDSAWRFQHMADLRVELEELQEESASGALAAEPPREQARRRTLAWAAVLLGLLGAAGLGAWFWLRRPAAEPATPMRAVLLTAYPGAETSPSFSPDGNQVAFSWNGEKQDNFDIYIKLIGPGAPLRLTTHPALDAGPAWSPDGRFIAFGRLLRGKIAILLIPALGGPERQAAEASIRPRSQPLPGWPGRSTASGW
jgi:hypothetical protein